MQMGMLLMLDWMKDGTESPKLAREGGTERIAARCAQHSVGRERGSVSGYMLSVISYLGWTGP